MHRNEAKAKRASNQRADRTKTKQLFHQLGQVSGTISRNKGRLPHYFRFTNIVKADIRDVHGQLTISHPLSSKMASVVF